MSSHPIVKPSKFARDALGMELYPKQIEVVDSLFQPDTRTSFACCNAGGKTSRIITCLILWHLWTWPRGKVKTTSGSWIQILDQLRPSLAAHKELFEDEMEFRQEPYIVTSEGGFWRGFSTNEPGRAEGDHADGEDRPMLCIIDEAKTVPDAIFQAFGRCVDLDSPTRYLIASSHGFAEGTFYMSQTLLKKEWQVFNQTAEDTPHITAESIAKVRSRWSGFPAFASSMLGEGFMPMVENAIIDLKALDFCLGNPCAFKQGEKHAFCDFAWSTDGDENVLALRFGNRVTIEAAFNCDNGPGIANQFAHHFRRLGLKSHEISGDEGGGGKIILDLLDEMGWVITRVNNQQSANDEQHYVSIAAEMWYEGSKRITANDIILPNDTELRGQLISRKRTKGSKGRLAIESKKDMKTRKEGGVPSPDRADAVLGCIAPVGGFQTAISGGILKITPMGVGGYTFVGL